ncbi:MAG: hypothetical protein ACK4GC_09815 [Paracoccaceae bacterium]
MDGLQEGIKNMLRHCAGLETGSSVLIVSEGTDPAHYDPDLTRAVAATAQAIGLKVSLCELAFSPEAVPPPPEVMAAIAASDAAVFLSRRGDQLRFDPVMAETRPVICYALDREMMASGFGRADHRGLLALMAVVNGALAAARHIRVTCPLGTDFAGTGARFPTTAGEVTVRRFPLSVFSPVPAADYAGTIALAGFLSGTGKTYYQPYHLPLSDVLKVTFDGNRITGFAGPDAAAARAHFGAVAEMLGVDASFVHSWHAGIHPGCAYEMQAAENIARWGCAAFGNPRVLHFHSCGTEPPGEISLNVIDPTIRLDGVAVWQDGRLYPDRVAGGAEVLAAHPCLSQLFAHPVQAIGLGPAGRLSAVPHTDPAR